MLFAKRICGSKECLRGNLQNWSQSHTEDNITVHHLTEQQITDKQYNLRKRKMTKDVTKKQSKK